MHDAHGALLAALRALVAAWDGPYHGPEDAMLHAIEQARALLRDLSPEEEGQ